MADDHFDGSQPRGATRPRGTSRVVRRFEWHSCVVTVWRGWRIESIERTLDTLADIEGGLYDDVPSNSFWTRKTGADAEKEVKRHKWRQEARRKVDLMRANSKRQTEVWRARARLEWEAYCRLYKQRFAGTDTVPVGFDRWSKTQLKAWKVDPEAVMHLNRRDRRAARAAYDRVVKSQIGAKAR